MSEDEIKPTELSKSDIENMFEILMREPRKCACGNGFPAEYEVSEKGVFYDLMCINCFQELTKDGIVIQIGN
jgi:hypothetical protein